MVMPMEDFLGTLTPAQLIAGDLWLEAYDALKDVEAKLAANGADPSQDSQYASFRYFLAKTTEALWDVFGDDELLARNAIRRARMWRNAERKALRNPLPPKPYVPMSDLPTRQNAPVTP
jgi:hypothetical protein